MTPAPAAAGGSRVSQDAGLERTTFANGLTVVSEHVPGVRSVALGAWVQSASVNESSEVMGVSHLLEHLVFKATERRTAREIAGSLESLGGSLDAYTSREHTAFQARVLDEHLIPAADVLADVMFRPLLRADDLALEKKVVLEEIAMVEDTPDDVVFELHNADMWGDHPYGYSILGTRRTVTDLALDDIRALHRRAYVASNVVVGAAGNLSHDELVDALGVTGWADLRRVDAPLQERDVVPATRPGVRHVAREAAQSHIVFGSSTLEHGDPRRHALVLVDTLLGGGMSSRLFQRVREELALAYSVYTFQQYHRDAGIHGVYAGTAPESALETVDAIRGELARLAAQGITTEELESTKRQLKGQITLSMESVSSRMYRAAASELFGEPWMTLDQLLRQVDDITLDGTRAACEEFFAPDRQTVIHLGP